MLKVQNSSALNDINYFDRNAHRQ